jgi:hypothetical protein
MKAIFVFLVIAAVTASEIRVESFDFTDGPTAQDFVKGFLTGIGETKSIDDMLKCVHSVEVVIRKIYEALELIKKLTFDNIVKGVTQLLAAVKELSDAVKPCSTGYIVLEKLIAAVINANYEKVLQKILQNSFLFIGYISNVISCFKEDQYECVGKYFGMILKSLFLSDVFGRPTTEIEALDFLRGFLEGLGGKFDDKNFEKCVKDFQEIITAIKTAFEAIIHGKISEIIKGITIIIQATKQLLNDIESCTKDVEVIKKLIQAIINFDLMKTAWKIVSHLVTVIEVITKTIPCFGSHDYYCIGKGFGSFLKIALL